MVCTGINSWRRNPEGQPNYLSYYRREVFCHCPHSRTSGQVSEITVRIKEMGLSLSSHWSLCLPLRSLPQPEGVAIFSIRSAYEAEKSAYDTTG